MSTTATSRKHGVFSRLYTGEGGVDFIGRSRLWYRITAALLIISVGVIALLVPSALLGLAGIGVAVVLHESSTLIVVLNALRLLRFEDRSVPAARSASLKGQPA